MVIKFREYARLVRQSALHEYTWGRDLTISTAIALVGAAIQIFGHAIPRDDRKVFIVSIVAPYVTVLGSHISYKFVRAPWKVYQEVQRQLETEQEKSALLQRKFNRVVEEPTGPEIALDFSLGYLVVKNIRGGTAHKIKVHSFASHRFVAEEVNIDYMAEGTQVHRRVDVYIESLKNEDSRSQLIDLIKAEHRHTKLPKSEATDIPVRVTYYDANLQKMFDCHFMVKYTEATGIIQIELQSRRLLSTFGECS